MSPESPSTEFAPPGPRPSYPRPVALAAGMATVLACYAIGMGVLAIPVGLFVGPQVLIAAAIHCALGAILFLAGRGLLRRDRAARRALMAASALGIVAIPILLALSGPADRSGWIFFGFLALYFAAMLVITALPAVGAWCSGPPGGWFEGQAR